MFHIGTPSARSPTGESTGRLVLVASALYGITDMAMKDARFAEIAQYASDWMASMTQRCCAFAVECNGDRSTARVVACANTPMSWSGETVPVDGETLIARALREPDVTHKGTGAVVLASLPNQTPPPVPCEAMVCAAIAAPPGGIGVLAACSALVESGHLNTLLPMLAKLMNALAGRRSSPASDEATRAAIQKAKLEWECTADALPQVVCLLDGNRCVVRANRAVERWGLGLVRDVRGRTAHDLLHETCDDSGCALGAALGNAWLGLDREESPAIEVQDPVLERWLSISLRPMQRAPAGHSASCESRAAMIVSDVTNVHQAQRELRALNEQLEARVQSRTRALMDVNHALRAQVDRCEDTERLLENSRDELAMLSAQLMRAQEDERRRIAQELHDSVGQELTAIKYSLERASELSRLRHAGEQQAQLAKAITGIRQVMDDIRSISMNLRPALLDDLGVVSALQWFCRQFADSYPQLDLQVHLRVSDADVPNSFAVPIYRTVQEALCNVVKHAAASSARVSLRCVAGSLVLEVADDGVGIPPLVHETGTESRLGLREMQERAEMTGGRFSIVSGPEQGSVISIAWPLGITQPQGQ